MTKTKAHQGFINLFIKFGDSMYLERLMNQGEIYLNTVEWFKMYETNKERKDTDEGIIQIEQIKKIIIKIEDGPEITFSKDSQINQLSDARLKMWYDKPLGNIYSLFAISRNIDEKLISTEINPRNTELGDSFLIIHNANEFLTRVVTKLNQLNYIFRYGMVSYYDLYKHSGELGIFHKPQSYAHQREFRIHVENTDGKPIVFQIGSIKDIAVLLHKNQLKLLRFKKIKYNYPFMD